MASVSGKRGTARRGAYTASKFGVIGLTQVMAQELGANGITVNAICPGSVDTSRRESTSRRERALAERDPDAAVLALPPTGRVARPDDIAHMALFFASVWMLRLSWRATAAWMYGLLMTALIVVELQLLPEWLPGIPALVPMGVAILVANWRHRAFTAQE